MSTHSRIVRFVTLIHSIIAGSMVFGVALAQDDIKSTSPTELCVASDALSSSNSSPFPQLDSVIDWYGRRSAIAERGITFDLSTTQFYQGVASGGVEREFQYGGRNDYFMRFDSEKAGLWKGGHVTLHGETRYGETANALTGALAPVNLMMALPSSGGVATGLTAVKFQQDFADRLSVYAGKLNTLDDFKQPLTGAGALQGFQNSALIYNSVYARTIPYSTLGAGFIYTSATERTFEFAVYDTNNTPTVNGFNTLFNNGATLYATGTMPTKLYDKPGHQGVSAVYSTGTYTDLTPTAFLDPTAGLVLLSTPVTGSWSVTYNWDQALYVSPDDPERMWGIFANLGLADNNPNPARWFGSAGISGKNPIANRKSDTFGIAGFYIGVSDGLKNSTTKLVDVGDEYGAELYYNVAVTSRLQLTPDLQVVSPFRNRVDPSVVVSLRAKIDF